MNQPTTREGAAGKTPGTSAGEAVKRVEVVVELVELCGWHEQRYWQTCHDCVTRLTANGIELNSATGAPITNPSQE